ncbi:Clavaminate synthase-like protein [Zopfia rhizophila CBS 207.26]|uniref:Clavaminate synthase-like protein n=1 Tax=Zopfia rhizophila CBS 207.26 TaxID=1314779 RepID=A0A6A6DUD3_9PEZI|nr:Clavaminate synthase-like protein [Zopfia rhizophila CBS 207.26]
MAPHAETQFIDSSGYTPSTDVITELKRKLRLHHPASVPGASWISKGSQTIDSRDTDTDGEASILQLSLSDLKEIEDAFLFFNATKLPLNKLQAEHFPLPTLSIKIRELSILPPDKQPYFLIRGLKPQWFSKYKNVAIYAGIASHVSTKRAFAVGDHNVLHHVTNIEIPCEKEEKIYRGPANRNLAVPFHTDYGAILSLYILSRPATGGDFYLADIHDIASQIARTRPDILETLRQPFVMVNPNVEGGRDDRPLLFTLPSGQFAIQASRTRLFGTACRPRPSSLPPLSAKQLEALDALHAAGQAVARRFEFRSGDMMFFNNLKMMHARDAFVDGNEEENTTKRYLLRLILKGERNDVNWELPPELNQIWEELYNHADEEEIFTVHPELFSFKASH